MSGRGPSTKHARDRGKNRLAHGFSPQRQTDILRRLRAGKGRTVRINRSGTKRWLLHDNGEILLVVASADLTRIITVWPVEPGSHQEKLYLRQAWRLEKGGASTAANAAKKNKRLADRTTSV